MNYYLVSFIDSQPYMFKNTGSRVVCAKDPIEAEKMLKRLESCVTITDIKLIDNMNRSLAQAYTHKVTLKQDLAGEKKGTEYVLFDDGKVFDSEIMAFREPPKPVVMVVQNWQHFPMLVFGHKNPQYHVHKYVEKTANVCECGDVEPS